MTLTSRYEGSNTLVKYLLLKASPLHKFFTKRAQELEGYGLVIEMLTGVFMVNCTHCKILNGDENDGRIPLKVSKELERCLAQNLQMPNHYLSSSYIEFTLVDNLFETPEA